MVNRTWGLGSSGTKTEGELAMELITGHSKILKEIEKFEKSEADRLPRMHLIAMSVLNHVNSHGDFTLATRFYLSFGKSADAAGFRFWLGQMCIPDVEVKDGLTYSPTKAKSFCAIKKDENGNFVEFVKAAEYKDDPLPGALEKGLELGLKLPWWELKAFQQFRDNGVPDFKAESVVKGIMRSLASKALDAEKFGYPALASQLRNMITELGAIEKMEAKDDGKLEFKAGTIKPELLTKAETQSSHAKPH